MNVKSPTAMKITPENLRVAVTAVPEINDCFVGDVLGAVLVRNVPQINKNGSISRRPPKKYELLTVEQFDAYYEYTEPKQRRAFVSVTLR